MLCGGALCAAVGGCCTADNREEMVEGGLVTSLVDASAGPYKTADIHARILNFSLVALVSLSFDSRVAAAYLYQQRGLDVISRVLVAVKDRPDVIDRAATLAFGLCRYRA